MQDTQSKVNTLIITFLAIYFIWLFANLDHIIPHFDSFYYWDWSRHLALSYYDGPPLIAYVLAIYTRLFGDTLFVINFFSLTTMYGAGFVIYKASRLFMEKRASLVAMTLWVISPVTTLFLVRQATYDNVLNLFWALSIYFSIKFVSNNRNINLYWLGICLGLTMLAKYSGIILILALLVFSLIVPRFRKLYSNLHFYIAMLIIVAIFSPVIIWNMQNSWVSISYQSANHLAHITSLSAHFINFLKMLSIKIIPLYNYFIVILVYGFIKCRSQIFQNEKLQLLVIVSIVFVIFYLVISFFINIHASWLLPSCVSIVILCAYFLCQLKMHKTSIILIAVYLVFSILLLVANSFLVKRITLEGGRLGAIQVFNKRFGKNHPIIVTSSWMSARMSFFLAGQPLVYTLPCSEENQYQFWSQKVFTDIRSKKNKEILYVDFINRHQCIAKYFAQCEQLPPAMYEQQHLFTAKIKRYHLNVYLCVNR